MNAVGVDLNTASAPLLARVSGLGKSSAEAIVAHRDANGPFDSRKELMKVSRLGARTFARYQGGKQSLVLLLRPPQHSKLLGQDAGIFSIVRDLAERGLAILLISDEVTEVFHNSDRILHMAHGRIVGEYDPRTTSVKALEEAIYE